MTAQAVFFDAGLLVDDGARLLALGCGRYFDRLHGLQLFFFFGFRSVPLGIGLGAFFFLHRDGNFPFAIGNFHGANFLDFGNLLSPFALLIGHFNGLLLFNISDLHAFLFYDGRDAGQRFLLGSE